MKLDPKLFAKYGTGILPPPPSEVKEEKVPTDSISPFLSEFVIEEGQDPLDPEIWDKYEPEITKDRSNTRLPHAVLEQLEDMRRATPHERAEPDRTTVDIKGKNATLLSRCNQYWKLATSE